jgi:hypothetical protein
VSNARTSASGRPPAAPPTEVVSCRVSPELKARLGELARKRGESLAWVAAQALEAGSFEYLGEPRAHELRFERSVWGIEARVLLAGEDGSAIGTLLNRALRNILESLSPEPKP